MEFNPGFDIIPTVNPMGFKYGADVFGPQVEYILYIFNIIQNKIK